MKSLLKSYSASLVAILLAACGESTTENVTNINQMGMDVVESVKELPKCEKDNEGEIAWVKGENTSRVCVDGKWFATKESVRDTVIVQGGKDTVVIAGDTVYMDGGDFSCTTKELKDKSGIKIICNGDSIGVVLNGEKGEKGDTGKDGEAGVGCTIAGQSDTTVTIKCGDKSMIMNVGAGGFSIDTLELDSEKIATPIESLEGYTQKGPFLKGSAVYLYELSDGRTLRQTNGNFMSYITSDDGRYRFSARDLVSQYAMVVVDGNYRNEVTGQKSEKSIRLRAITDVTARNSVNVNLLTNLEYERVHYLVTQKKMKVKNAKKQAQAEIFAAFHIDTTGFAGSSEDFDVFGKTDADAALLAISIMLQGDRDEADLTVLLTEISDDLAADGKWDGPNSDSIKAEIADSTLNKDDQGLLAIYRKNVKDWGLSTTVPQFEKYIRTFYEKELGLGACGRGSSPVGTVKNVSNPNSMYYVEKYYDITGTGGKTRFICKDADSPRWQTASDLEKDRFDWDPKNSKDGSLLDGPITGRKMVWDADTLRYAQGDLEINGGKGCTSYNQATSELYVLKHQYSYYRCTKSGWELALDTLNRGTLEYEGQTYKTIGIKTQMWMAENLNYKIEGRSYCYGDSDENCAKYGRLYTWATAVGKTEEECGYTKECKLPDTVQGICPDGWHLPNNSEWNKLYAAMDSNSDAMQATGFAEWEHATDTYGFSALPAGIYYENGYVHMGSWARFWSSGQQSIHMGYQLDVYQRSVLPNNCGDKRDRYSVRCVKD